MAVLIIWAGASLAVLPVAVPLFAACGSWESSSPVSLLWHLSGLSPASGGQSWPRSWLTTRVSLLDSVTLWLTAPSVKAILRWE